MLVGKSSILPTKHYLLNHSDVKWDLVVLTILSPTKIRPNLRYGKDRFTYIKRFSKFVVELHVKRDDVDCLVWVINAFLVER
jgi:hypothetical protein